MHSLLQAIVATGILVVICAMLALGLGIILVGRPVRRLVQQARRIGAGDLSGRLDLRQRDEIGQLALEMNAMCEKLNEARHQLRAESEARISTLEQLRHADRLMTVGKLAAGIAHEIGTPLNVITGYAQLIADESPGSSPVQESASIITQQVHRVAEIIRQLLDFARKRAPCKTIQDLGQTVHQVAVLLETLAQKRKVVIRIAVPEEAMSVEVDPGQIQQALTNLMVTTRTSSAEAFDILRQDEFDVVVTISICGA